MKRAMIGLLFVLNTSGITLGAEEPGLRLEICPSQRTLRLGQQMTVQVKITGSDLNWIVEGMEGGILPVIPAPTFTCNVTLKPERQGPIVLGPYEMTFNGVELKSNVATIEVLPEMPDVVGTFLRVDKKEIALGESIELVIETRTKTTDEQPLAMPPSIRLKRGLNRTYQLADGPMISSNRMMQRHEGGLGSKATLTTQIYEITPNEAGEFHINNDFFENLPADCEAPNITIIVYPTEGSQG